MQLGAEIKINMFMQLLLTEYARSVHYIVVVTLGTGYKINQILLLMSKQFSVPNII